MGDEGLDVLLEMPWWEWAGPIVPPNEKAEPNGPAERTK
jgi:hypothetical protein